MSVYRAALCGLGNIAWLFDRDRPAAASALSHAGAYQRQPQTSLMAGCSPDPAARETFQQAMGLPAYPDLDELLDREQPDIVSICSPSAVHFQQVMTCLERGGPMIWLEKPPTLSLRDTETLLAKAATGRGTVSVNYQRRFLPIYQEFREWFRAQALGPCRQVQATYSRGLETNGSHILDMLFFVMGDEAECRLHWVSPASAPDNPSFFMTIGGIEVVVTGTTLPYHNIDLTMTCEEGRLAVLHGGMTGVVERKSEHELFPGFYRLKARDDQGFSGLAGLAHAMENALADLLASHAQGRLPASNLHSASRGMTLIHQVREWQAGRRGP